MRRSRNRPPSSPDLEVTVGVCDGERPAGTIDVVALASVNGRAKLTVGLDRRIAGARLMLRRGRRSPGADCAAVAAILLGRLPGL